MKYFVEIVNFETGEVVKRIDCGENERHADRVDDGANINLNHDEYFTRIVKRYTSASPSKNVEGKE